MAAGFQDRCQVVASSIRDNELCQNCKLIGAHFGALGLHCLASADADLQSVVLAWGKISKPIRRAILALVDSAVAAGSDAPK